MKFNIRTEIYPLLLILLPYTYLPFVWNRMPEELPVHWDINNNADRMVDKSAAWAIPLIISGGIYALLWLIAWVDPKQRLQEMASKFHQLKLMMVASFTLLIFLILYNAARNEIADGSTWIMMFQGILFSVLGNFFQSLKPNYFIGIRTPWTLEFEWIWRKTHKVFGWVWIIGGLAILALPFLLPDTAQGISGTFTLVVLVGMPYLYSFILWKCGNKKAKGHIGKNSSDLNNNML
jgi:uncharacterized membrane protein